MTTTSSSVIKSSIVKSSCEAVISVRLSSPNWDLISINSSRITCISLSGEANISSNSLIKFNSSSNSLIILSCSRAVSLCNLNSSIACACASDNLYPLSCKPYSSVKSSGLDAFEPAFSNMAFTNPGCHILLNKALFAS